MLTKFILHIGETEYELQDDDLRNWDEIRCSYKRASYDGVVRSFTSQFEFVNRAKELLLEIYLKDRFNAQAYISVLTSSDRWIYEERFRCPLDFSTVSWEAYTLKINSVDNSLAALIKANKSTKYEFAIGSELFRDAMFNFDRMPMKESLTYEFTQGTQYDNCADILVRFDKDQLPWVGNVGSEITINGTLDWRDDQETEPSSYLFNVIKDVEVEMEYELEWRTDTGYGYGTNLGIRIRRNGALVDGTYGANDGNGGYFAFPSRQTLYNQGTYSNPGALPDVNSLDHKEGSYAIISGLVWVVQYNGRGYIWKGTGKTPTEYFVNRRSGRVPLKLQAGDTVFMDSSFSTFGGNFQFVTIRFIKSKFTFKWISVGNSVNIEVFKPKKIATQLLRKIAADHVNVDVFISEHDPRIANTYLLAAESARGILGAKFYSSFNEFCDWMATVFGYVYYIGNPQPSKYKYIRTCGEYEGSPWNYVDETYVGSVNTNNIVYIPQHARFLYHDTTNGKLYVRWPGWTDYNHPGHGHPRTDTLYRILELSSTDLYYFDEYAGSSLYPKVYDHSEDYIGNDGQTVYFVHRSEVLDPSANVRVFPYCRGLKYSVDTSVIYSTITAGYDKKDYDYINGRDEFNFNNTYTTGCTVSDKTLSLLSKYRADCYGIEFAVQKRDEDTTDTTSDKDVFFVLCSFVDGDLTADRSLEIQNSLTGAVFNGAFSPMACIRANAGYIGLQADEMTLRFASSTGNSSIVISGEAMSGDITLDTPLATCGTIEFTTDEIDDIADVNELIEVEDDGVIYRGFLKEVDIKYAKTEAAKYKLIVKEIEL